MKKDTQSHAGYVKPPVVVVLGHVDHGKTTLLDAIRKTNVASGEAGGITQRVGASLVTTEDGKRITFIDTPGHAAFSSMRARGAKMADIAVLVVAGDDGIKPQTKEALEYILNSKIPFIVAVTKTDLPSASTEAARAQLEQAGVLFEGSGGDVPILSVSAKKNEGIEELLEMILLIAELHEISANPEANMKALVLETTKDKKGPIVLVVVENGTLTVGMELVAEQAKARVRGLFDHTNKNVQNILPGEPAQILGFSNLPEVGSQIWEEGRSVEIALKSTALPTIQSAQEYKLACVIKAQNAGALEAIISNIPKEVFVISRGIGDVLESDVLLAKTQLGAFIFAFETKIPTSVVKLAKEEGVKVKRFDIIYELFEEMQSLLAEEEAEKLGEAQILASFPYDKMKVAGCKVIDGRIAKEDAVQVKRGDKTIGEAKIISMKRQKQEIAQAKQGEECGVILGPQLDFEVGDVLVSVRK